MAIAPKYETDYELSQYPVIVVAKWDKAEMIPHNLIEGNWRKECEAFTDLNVIRVIKGDLRPGKHRVMLGCAIGWWEDGTGLATYTSTQIGGDVENVTEVNLWFLEQKRSWDRSDRTSYLYLSYFRAVQPMVLEPYFRAVVSENRDKDVPKLLLSGPPEVVRRALRYICGEILPWPYEPGEWNWDGHPDSRERLLVDAAPQVRAVIGRDLEEVRPLAVAVYSKLRGRYCVEFLRTLLADKNSSVRGIVVGLLARFQENSALEAMVEAIEGVDDGPIACELIDVLGAWGDPRISPILITFLENDELVYQSGNDLGIPAVKARAALYTVTDHWFPFDVTESTRAWRAVEPIGDRARRAQRLAELLPGTEFPVTAELVGKPRRPLEASGEPGAADTSMELTVDEHEYDTLATVSVRNVSAKRVSILRIPDGKSQLWPTGVIGGGCWWNRKEREARDFVSLLPNEATEFEISLDGSFLLAEPATRTLTLCYANLGTEHGHNAWIGVLPVQFGPLWEEERRIERVKERWPGGTLRAIGRTVNGRRFGLWNFFNEQGDWVERIDYTGGHGTASGDPELPSNKGAAQRYDHNDNTSEQEP